MYYVTLLAMVVLQRVKQAQLHQVHAHGVGIQEVRYMQAIEFCLVLNSRLVLE